MNYEDLLESKTFPLVIEYKNKRIKTDKVSQQVLIFNRLKELETEGMTMHINPSNTTESVYVMVTFWGKLNVFIFSIKNHVSRGDSVSVEYSYKDFASIHDLFRRVETDIELAWTKKRRCVTTSISTVEYDALNFLKGCSLVVKTNGKDQITSVTVKDENGRLLSSKPRFLSTSLVQELYRRKMLVDLLNRSTLQELVISKFGFLALRRNRYKYDCDVKFANCAF